MPVHRFWGATLDENGHYSCSGGAMSGRPERQFDIRISAAALRVRYARSGSLRIADTQPRRRTARAAAGWITRRRSRILAIRSIMYRLNNTSYEVRVLA